MLGLWYLRAPQLDSPVKGGSNKQVGKVQGPGRCVTVDPRDGSMVALKHLTDACFAVEHRLGKGLWQIQLSMIHLIPESCSWGVMTLLHTGVKSDPTNALKMVLYSAHERKRHRWTSAGHFHINHLLISCDYQQGWQKCLQPLNHMLQSC